MKRTGTKAAIYIILTAASIIAIFPFIWTFIASTHNNTEICPDPPNRCHHTISIPKQPVCYGLPAENG